MLSLPNDYAQTKPSMKRILFIVAVLCIIGQDNLFAQNRLAAMQSFQAADGKWGYRTPKEHKKLLPAVFDHCYNFSEDATIAQVRIDNEHYLMDRLNATMNNGGGGGSAPAQIKSGMSAAYYQEMYNRYARVVESAYNSLTSTGVSVTHSDGSKSGSAAGNWQGSNYSQMKSELHKAQSDMRRIRSEAARAGHTIGQSHWETVTVSY